MSKTRLRDKDECQATSAAPANAIGKDWQSQARRGDIVELRHDRLAGKQADTSQRQVSPPQRL
jgi:hypothetical protein